MKAFFTIALLAAMALGGCAPTPKPQAASGDPALAALADQAAPTPKKKRCPGQLGSRLAVCGEGSTGDYAVSESGQAYRDYMLGRSIGSQP